MNADELEVLLKQATLTKEELRYYNLILPPGDHPSVEDIAASMEEVKEAVARAQLEKAARAVLWGLNDYLVWWAKSVREELSMKNPQDDWFQGYWRALHDIQSRISRSAYDNALQRPKSPF